jgi:hypothetical protein
LLFKVEKFANALALKYELEPFALSIGATLQI